jgi:hypothetical protein
MESAPAVMPAIRQPATRPPCDMRFGSSNTALVRARLCDNLTCEVSSPHGRWERRELPSSSSEGTLSVAAPEITTNSPVD